MRSTSNTILRRSISTLSVRRSSKPAITWLSLSSKIEADLLDPAEAALEDEYRTLMRKFWFAAVITIPVIALSYPDLIPGLRDWMPMGSGTRRVVWALLGVLSFPVMVLVRLAIL